MHEVHQISEAYMIGAEVQRSMALRSTTCTRPATMSRSRQYRMDRHQIYQDQTAPPIQSVKSENDFTLQECHLAETRQHCASVAEGRMS